LIQGSRAGTEAFIGRLAAGPDEGNAGQAVCAGFETGRRLIYVSNKFAVWGVALGTPTRGGSVPEIIILACIALFLAFRLYAVLGRRTGHEQPIAKPADLQAAPLIARPAIEPIAERKADAAGTMAAMIDPHALDGVRQIVAADPHFDVASFLDGARSAYRMVLEAFWKGDEAELRRLVDDEVYHAFADSIAARNEAGETLENRLVSIERSTIDQAGIAGQMAVVAVRFDADIAAITRDGEGNVVAGSLSDAVQTHDLWTFSRHVRADDPNWILIETDEVA
jgi:predicted lipid-binding transport protein (Tim44 family)